MNSLINFNGALTGPQTPVATAFNRSLRYGDGLFETMFWDGQKILQEEYHLDRLFRGLLVLAFDLSGGFTRKFISDEIRRLCENNAHATKARVRLNVFREDGSLLLPMVNKPVFIIETAYLPEQKPDPLRLTVYTGDTKSTGILSNLKTNNYLLPMLAIQFAWQQGADDALILNCRGNICEASSSNIFMIQKGILHTPALSEGCVAGTKRRELMETLTSLGFQVEETIISPESLHEMEEVFLTNAIRGIRPVAGIDDKKYLFKLTAILMRLLNQSMA